MPNYIYTPDNYFVSSILSEDKKKTESREDCQEVEKEKTTLDFGFLYSIELSRNEIKKKLLEYFEFDEDNVMFDFLESNNDVLQVLPHLARFILTHVSGVKKLTVSLLNESASWKTLFINIYSNASWEETNKISEEIFTFLDESRPTVFNKINFTFYQE
jgi:hypothetical protein